MADATVKITCEQKGFDEAIEKVEALADARNEFPPQVVVRNCTNCEINIHPSQTKIIEYGSEDERIEE